MLQLIYLPVERYKNRWTEYVSGPDGMFAHGVRACDDIRLTTIAPDNSLREIKMGAVLDVSGRAAFAFWQVEKLIEMIQAGKITNDTVIYIEDFWHPGFEMIPYACHIAGVRPVVYAFCHAQSVDPNDFTHPMREWMRPIETGWARWLTGIFVAAQELKNMLVQCKVAPEHKVHVTGTVMRRQVLVDAGWIRKTRGSRMRDVIFASRPDPEKDPYFFIKIAEKMRRRNIEFSYLSSRKLPQAVASACAKACVNVYDNLSKREYFGRLLTASLAFNCAKQDFIGYCQLDALAAGCPVLCPNYLTFPTLLQSDSRYLYEMGNVEDACAHVDRIVDETAGTPAGGALIPELYMRFGMPYEGSVSRMTHQMFLDSKQ